MRAAILLVELPYNIEYLRPQIDALEAALPSGSKAVLYSEKMIAIGILDAAVPDAILARASKALEAFSRHWLLGANGMIVSRDGPIDPLQTWVHENFGTAPARKRGQPQDMLKPQRRVIGLKRSN